MRLAHLGKTAWYLFGGILVLSLPTFSYLIPDRDLVLGTLPRSGQGQSRTGRSGTIEGRGVFARLSGLTTGGSSFTRAVSGASSFVPRGKDPGVSTPPFQTRVGAQGSAAVKLPLPAGRLAQPAANSEVFSRMPESARSEGRALAAHSPYGGELWNVERGYQAAMGQLFQNSPFGVGGYFGNPFDDALPPDSGGNGDSNGDNGGDDNQNGNGGNNGGGDNTNSGGDNPPPPPPNDGGQATKRYSYLVIGEIPGLGAGVARAYRDTDGSFVVDGTTRFDPFSGTLGGTPGLIGLGQNEQVLADDVNGDGQTDLVMTQLTTQGTLLDLYFKEPSGGYQRAAGAFFLWKAIAGLAWLDFSRDGQLDLAVLFRNEPNLFVYTYEGEEFKYLKEIVLPFEASLVVDSLFEGFLRERRLHVFDAAFRRVATLTSRNPGVFLLGLPGPAQGLRGYKLDADVDGAEAVELAVFEYGGRILVAEKKGVQWVLLGSFTTTGQYPLVVFGDYLHKGFRQLFCLP